jgi:hypothetical protein
VRELGLAALLSSYVPEGQLLSGLIIHTALSHWLPLIAGAFFAGHELRRGIFPGEGRKATPRRRPLRRRHAVVAARFYNGEENRQEVQRPSRP